MSGRPSRGFASKGFFTALAFALTVRVDAARAEPQEAEAEPFRLVWSSSAGCHDEREFLAELGSRTARLRSAGPAEHAITLIVETFRSESGVRGQLTVRKPDGDLTVREVPGSSCQEVQAAMALIAALMVDPLAGQTRPRRRQPLVRPARPPRPASSWSMAAEHRLTARTAIADELVWGQALGVMVTAESSRWKPSLRLVAGRSEATLSGEHGSAELSWTAAELALCPVGIQPEEAWDLRACATAELGRLRGAGFATADPATKSVLWSGAGAQLAARYRPVAPLWLGLECGLNFPFTRERFYLEPGETLHRVPGWGVAAGVGLGLRFF